MITYTKNENGFSVKVPYELKDAFRAIFKTAKKDESKKDWHWQVGPRAEKKLTQFIADTAATQDKIEAQKKAAAEQDLIEYDIQKLQSELQRLHIQLEEKKIALKNAVELQAMIEKSKAIIATHTLELNEVTDELDKTELAIKVEKEEITKMLINIIDMSRVLELKSILERNHVPSDRVKKSRFETAQKELKTMIATLRNAGLKSIGINQMYYANINRPDRDSVSNISFDRVFEIVNIDESIDV